MSDFVLENTLYLIVILPQIGTRYEWHPSETSVDDVNLIGDDIRTKERNADVLLNACKDVGLTVNIGKTKYMEIGRNRRHERALGKGYGVHVLNPVSGSNFCLEI